MLGMMPDVVPPLVSMRDDFIAQLTRLRKTSNHVEPVWSDGARIAVPVPKAPRKNDRVRCQENKSRIPMLKLRDTRAHVYTHPATR